MILSDWNSGVTGKGNPRWVWCVRRGTSLADGFVEVKFRPEAGQQDQAGGVVWRWENGDNDYVARGNALENNVSLYYTENARRNTLKYVDAPVASNEWHTLPCIEMDDTHIAGAGAVGVWTKADSVTAFEDFRYGP